MGRVVLEALACAVLRVFLVIALCLRPRGRSKTLGEAGPDPDWR